MEKKQTDEKLAKRVRELGKENIKLKRSDELLRESEERFRLLYENAPLAYQSLDENGQFLEVNQVWLDTLGYTREEIIGKSFGDFLHPDWEDHFKENFRRFKAVGEILGVEFEVVKKDGDTILVAFNGKIGKDEKGDFRQTHCILHDITEKRRTENALYQAKRDWEKTFDAISDWICLLDKDNTLIRTNQMGAEVLGTPLEQMIGRKCCELLHGTEDPIEGCPFEKTQKTHKRETSEIHFPDKDKWFLITVDPFFDEEGNLTGAVHMARDITASKKIEDQLRQAQKMESIGTLAGGIAHEFNNILGIIIGNTELALMDVPDWNPVKECLEETRKASIRAKDVVRQITSFARKTPLGKKPIQIGTIIKESLKLIRATTPTIIEIRQAILCESEMILAQPTEISQIFMNLCSNSAHAIGEEAGVLEVNLENEELRMKNEELGLEAGRYVKLTVRDTGSGIKPEIIDRIFDPYFTTKDVDEGLGMGLAVVYGIVKKHDGAIKVKSEVDKGTVVEVLFPIIKAEVEGEVEEPETLRGDTGRILFVDDEASLAKMTAQMLVRLGYEVVTKTNPKEALALFKAEPDRFDLVITDMAMPYMTGVKLAQELMAIRQDIAVILCTGHSDRIDEVKALRLGFKAYATKPLVMENLANLVRKVLDHK